MEVDEDGGGDDRDVTARRRVACRCRRVVGRLDNIKTKKRFAALYLEKNHQPTDPKTVVV